VEAIIHHPRWEQNPKNHKWGLFFSVKKTDGLAARAWIRTVTKICNPTDYVNAWVIDKVFPVALPQDRIIRFVLENDPFPTTHATPDNVALSAAEASLRTILTDHHLAAIYRQTQFPRTHPNFGKMTQGIREGKACLAVILPSVEACIQVLQMRPGYPLEFNEERLPKMTSPGTPFTGRPLDPDNTDVPFSWWLIPPTAIRLDSTGGFSMAPPLCTTCRQKGHLAPACPGIRSCLVSTRELQSKDSRLYVLHSLQAACHPTGPGLWTSATPLQVESSGRFKPFVELHFADRAALQSTLEMKSIAIVTGTATVPNGPPDRSKPESSMDANGSAVDPVNLQSVWELPIVPINGCMICLAGSYHAPRSCPKIKERTYKKSQNQTRAQSRPQQERFPHPTDWDLNNIGNPDEDYQNNDHLTMEEILGDPPTTGTKEPRLHTWSAQRPGPNHPANCLTSQPRAISFFDRPQRLAASRPRRGAEDTSTQWTWPSGHDAGNVADALAAAVAANRTGPTLSAAVMVAMELTPAVNQEPPPTTALNPQRAPDNTTRTSRPSTRTNTTRTAVPAPVSTHSQATAAPGPARPPTASAKG
jgi:hypothetical protein